MQKLFLKGIFPLCSILFLSGCDKETVTEPHVPFVYTDSVADNEGNYYHTVTIGSQVWMAENLRSTKYRNGDTIVYEDYSSGWSNATGGAFCNYDNNSFPDSIYGKIYNYRAVSDPRLLAPSGWHIASQAEWETLLAYAGENAGEKLREYGSKHWFPPNADATDVFGFCALPGGRRDDQGDFRDVRDKAYFWTSTHYAPSNVNYPEAWHVEISHDLDPVPGQASAVMSHSTYQTGCYVRCIKD
jgi:uncharacterized protein (TIGR02145 family)